MQTVSRLMTRIPLDPRRLAEVIRASGAYADTVASLEESTKPDFVRPNFFSTLDDYRFYLLKNAQVQLDNIARAHQMACWPECNRCATPHIAPTGYCVETPRWSS